MARKELQTQRDFTGGELMPEAKRRDDVAQVHTGCRQIKNFRALAIGGAVQRPGRRALFYPEGTRNEPARMSAAADLIVCFSAGKITLTNTAGAVIASNTSASYLWTADTLAKISWCIAGAQIVVCFPGMRPQFITYASSSNTWTFAPLQFRTMNNAVQMPFWRRSAPGATITPSWTTGAITLTCSTAYFTSAMVGRMLSLLGQQVTITSVTSPTVASASVNYFLCPWVAFTVAAQASMAFPEGSLVTDGTNKAEVGTYAGVAGTTTVPGTLMGLSGTLYSGGTKTLIGPTAQSPSSQMAGITTPQPTVQWQEDFMGDVAGWPAACFYDRGRLGFCDFPQAPEAIAWSAIGSNDIFWVDSTAAAQSPSAGTDPNAAILELIPGKPRVLNVAGWGDEFAFTDRGVYQIPISVTNPLKPGSVEFRQLSTDGVAPIRPVVTELALLYVNAGTNRVSAVSATGSVTRPYVSNDLSDAHAHLFTDPVSMTVATGDGKHPERYVYVGCANGSVIVGKFTPDKQLVGWIPWESADLATWVSASGASVYVTTTTGAKNVLQVEDDAAFLDCCIPINALPAALTIAGKGPCLPFAGGLTTLMDGTRDLGDRQVDADGNIVTLPGDDFSASTVMAGLIYTGVCEPFAFQAQPGAAAGQRERRRKITRAIVSVINSCGFTWGDRVIPPYKWGENPEAPPVLRETSYRTSQLGRDFDPRVTLTKSRPGPLTILEIALEVTI